jgi:putative intracellular protease/amidase
MNNGHSQNQVLVVLTNTREFPERGRRDANALGLTDEEAHRTGFDIKEVAYLYECLTSPEQHQLAGPQYQITFASPRGGECHFDPDSLKSSEHDEAVRRFLKDHRAMQLIKSTRKIDEIRPEQYQCVCFPGGPGTLFDLPHNDKINQVVQSIWEEKHGIVAAIGHGICALLNVKSKRSNEPLLKGRKVTCNTVEEEREMQLDKALPFMVENKLKEIGARFEKSNKFDVNVVVDERIITGQNRNSTKEWVARIRQQMKQ